MVLNVRGLNRVSKDRLFNVLDRIAKGEVKLKAVTWGDFNTLILDIEE